MATESKAKVVGLGWMPVEVYGEIFRYLGYVESCPLLRVIKFSKEEKRELRLEAWKATMKSGGQKAFRYFHKAKRYHSDKEFALAAVTQDGQALMHASDELKNDKDVVLVAVKEYGRALIHASEELRNDREVVQAAVKEYGWALRWASYESRNDKDIVLAAITQNKEYAFQWASEELKTDPDVLAIVGVRRVLG